MGQGRSEGDVGPHTGDPGRLMKSFCSCCEEEKCGAMDGEELFINSRKDLHYISLILRGIEVLAKIAPGVSVR